MTADRRDEGAERPAYSEYPAGAAAGPGSRREPAGRAAGHGAATRRVLIGAALLVLAVFVWVGRSFAADGGAHSWDPDAEPPAAVQLTQGQQYAVSTPDGPGGLIARQVTTQPQVSCTLTGDGRTTALQLALDVSNERITHQIGTFVSPASGRFAVRCDGTGAVFVDDADDAAFDGATALVALCSVLALFGVAFLLSGLTGRPRDEHAVDGAADQSREAAHRSGA